MPAPFSMSVAGGTHGFRLLPARRYGTAPDLPAYDGQLLLDLLLPDPPPPAPAPAVIYLHGGGWRHGSPADGLRPWLSPLLASRGYVAANVAYRLSGRSPFPAQLHDVKAAVRWLRAHATSYGIDADRLGVWGDSAGGHLALLLGLTPGVPELSGACGSRGEREDVRAVVARCAPTDLAAEVPSEEAEEVYTQLFGGPRSERTELVRLASPLRHVRAGGPPISLTHGTDDEVVPYADVACFAETLRAAGGSVDLTTVEGGHHNLTRALSAQWTEVPWSELGVRALEFFDQHLSRASTPSGAAAGAR